MALNPQNLVNFKDRSPEEMREIAKRANQKSQEAKKRKKMLKELLEVALSQETETGDYYMDMTKALILKAVEGDTKAYEVIRDTLGQKPKDEVEISSGDVINIKIGNDKNKS